MTFPMILYSVCLKQHVVCLPLGACLPQEVMRLSDSMERGSQRCGAGPGPTSQVLGGQHESTIQKSSDVTRRLQGSTCPTSSFAGDMTTSVACRLGKRRSEQGRDARPTDLSLAGRCRGGTPEPSFTFPEVDRAICSFTC